MGEQRNEHRPRTFKGGTIDFGVGTFDCTVRNLTVQGALLDTVSPFGLPDCQSAWGPDADRLDKSLMHVGLKGSMFGADLQSTHT